MDQEVLNEGYEEEGNAWEATEEWIVDLQL